MRLPYIVFRSFWHNALVQLNSRYHPSSSSLCQRPWYLRTFPPSGCSSSFQVFVHYLNCILLHTHAYLILLIIAALQSRTTEWFLSNLVCGGWPPRLLHVLAAGGRGRADEPAKREARPPAAGQQRVSDAATQERASPGQAPTNWWEIKASAFNVQISASKFLYRKIFYSKFPIKMNKT